MKRRGKIILSIILVFIGLILLRLTLTKPATQTRPLTKVSVEKATVKVKPVTREDIDLAFSYIGNIKAKDEVEVFSKVSGKLAEYTANEGDSVQKGQAIALIDRDETGLKYELAKVESPISGILARTLLDKGDNVLVGTTTPQGTKIAVVVNMEEMIVRLNIPEQDIPNIKRGLKAQIRVDAYPEDNFIGEISKVSEVVDPQTRTLPIEITMPNSDHRLKSGMFGRIKIISSHLEDRLILSQDALVKEWGANYVFLIEGHIAKKKKVTLGIRDDSRVEILDGLKDGDRVIVFGQQGLKDGTPVGISEE